MRLSQLIVGGRLIEVFCQECGAKTPLDPFFFIARRGDIELGKLGECIYCAQCGSADIEIGSIKPARENL
jgi:hypothetical protein